MSSEATGKSSYLIMTFSNKFLSKWSMDLIETTMPYKNMNSARSVPSETALSIVWISMYLELLVTATLRVFQSWRMDGKKESIAY